MHTAVPVLSHDHARLVPWNYSFPEPRWHHQALTLSEYHQAEQTLAGQQRGVWPHLVKGVMSQWSRCHSCHYSPAPNDREYKMN